MATLEFSASLAQHYVNRMTASAPYQLPYSSVEAWSSSCPLLATNGGDGSGNRAVPQIYLMKGVMPSDFSTLTSYSVRSSDVLVTYDSGTSDIIIPATKNPLVITTNLVTATASGTATWFWWAVRQNNYPGVLTVTAPIVHQIIGNVGLVGSGSDLEIADVNIIAGFPYRIANLGFRFPATWTV